MLKKLKNYKVNFVQPLINNDISNAVDLAAKNKMSVVCLSCKIKDSSDYKWLCQKADEAQAQYKLTVIIGLRYSFGNFVFTVYGGNAIKELLGRPCSEESLLYVKSMHNCTVIMHDISSEAILDLEFKFNASLIDAYEKYHNGLDSIFSTPILENIRLSKLKNSQPISCSDDCITGFSIIRKEIRYKRDLVDYLRDRRPISMYAEFMLNKS